MNRHFIHLLKSPQLPLREKTEGVRFLRGPPQSSHAVDVEGGELKIIN